MKTYVVKQGDYLTRLAATRGLDPDAVWSLAENRTLRERRQNREMLAPGDVIHFPEQLAAGPSVSVGTMNRYKATVPTVHVRVRLQSESRPREGEAFVVDGAGAQPITGTTGADGVVAFDVPISVSQCLLRLPARGAAYPVLVGHLDPHDEPSGIAARLEHLGFLSPDLRSTLAQGLLGVDVNRPTIPEWLEDALGEAIRAFQRQSGLTPTGVADADTVEALRRAHDGDEAGS